MCPLMDTFPISTQLLNDINLFILDIVIKYRFAHCPPELCDGTWMKAVIRRMLHCIHVKEGDMYLTIVHMPAV